MKNVLSQNLISLAEICPFPLYVVGGRVRDFLGGLKAEKPDCDICAPVGTGDITVFTVISLPMGAAPCSTPSNRHI